MIKQVNTMGKKITKSAKLAKNAKKQPKMGKDYKAKRFIPLGCTRPQDRNFFEIKKQTDAFIKADEGTRQQMMLKGIIDAVDEQGDLIPVTNKTLNEIGEIVDYRKWRGPQDDSPLIVLETRIKADKTPYANKGSPIKPWWQCNLWGISSDDDDRPFLQMVQISGDGLAKLDLGKIPWHRPCEITVTDDWTLILNTPEDKFIREIVDEAAAKDFVGDVGTSFAEGDLLDIIKTLSNTDSGEEIFTTINDAAIIDWKDFYCSDCHLYSRNNGLVCDIIDESIDPTTPITCRYYPQHVVEQLIDSSGGCTALVFYRPIKKTNKKSGKEEFTLDIYGTVVYDYDEAEAAEERS